MQDDKTKEQVSKVIMQPDAPEEATTSGDAPAEALQEIITTARGDQPKKRKRSQEMKPAKRPSFFQSVPFRFGAVILTTLMLFCLVYNFAHTQGLTRYTLGLNAGTGLVQAFPAAGKEIMTFYGLEAAALEEDRFENVIALSKVRQASDLGKGTYMHDYVLAYAYSHLGDYQKAIHHQKLAAKAPSSLYAVRFATDLAMMQEEAGDFNSALTGYMTSETMAAEFTRQDRSFEPYLFPNRQWAKQEWGQFHPSRKRGSFVLSAVNRQSYLADSLMNNNIAHCYVQLNNPAAAIEYANKALATDAGCTPAYKNKALAELQLGQLDNALADANKALKLDNNYIAGLLARSQIYDRIGDTNKSAADRQLADRLKQELSRAAS